MQGIRKDGGTAGKPLFQNQIIRPQLLLQQAGPALRFVEAVAAVGAVRRVGAIAVGVGIAEAYNVFFHD